MVEDIKTKRQPIMLGPVLVHQKFCCIQLFCKHLNQFAQTAKTCFGLWNRWKQGVSWGFIPFAIQLHCFLCFKKNVDQKLENLVMPSYIFGKHVENTYQEGVVDSSSQQEFYQHLTSLKELWDEWALFCVNIIGTLFSTRLMLCTITWGRTSGKMLDLASAVPENFTGLDVPCSSQQYINQSVSVSISKCCLVNFSRNQSSSPTSTGMSEYTIMSNGESGSGLPTFPMTYNTLFSWATLCLPHL